MLDRKQKKIIKPRVGKSRKYTYSACILFLFGTNSNMFRLTHLQVLDRQLKLLESMVQGNKQSLPIFFSRMSASHFFEVWNCDSKSPLKIAHNMVLLCVSAIGFANAFIQAIEKVFLILLVLDDFD